MDCGGAVVVHLDPDADDFQNVAGTFLSKDRSWVKFCWRCDQSFLREVANRQTNAG